MPINLERLTLGPAMRFYAVGVLYAPPQGLGFVVPGVFDRQHVEVFGADGVPVSTLRAQLGVRLAAFPDGFVPAQGDHVLVALRGGHAIAYADPVPTDAALAEFVVQDVQQDAEGGAMLILSEA